MPKIPFKTFAPDLDPKTPGVLVDGSDFWPTMKGMRTLPALVTVPPQAPATAPAGPCLGVFSGTFASTDGTQSLISFLILGYNQALQVYLNLPLSLGIPWLPLQTFTTFTEDSVRWRFAFYQNRVYAVDGANPMVVMTYAAALAAIQPPGGTAFTIAPGNPPIASIVAASDFSLFLIEPNSATWHSTVNPGIWVDDVATSTVSDTIEQTSGPITAALALRSNMVLYKRNSMFVGSLSGPPNIWQFPEVSRQVGAQSQEAVVSVRDVHYLWGNDDFYYFDGFSVNPLQNAVKEWLFNRAQLNALTPQLLPAGRFDDSGATPAGAPPVVIFWHYQTVTAVPGTIFDEWVCINVRTGQWATGHTLVDFPISSVAVFPNNPSGVVLSTDHELSVYNGARPDTIPTATMLNNYLSTNNPEDYRPSATVPLSADGWFNLLNTARMQRLQLRVGDAYITTGDVGDGRNMYMTTRIRPSFGTKVGGDVEVIEWEPDVTPAGEM